jgi:hypothetical protein
MSRGQSLLEFSIVLPILLFVLVAGWIMCDAHYRVNRVQFAASVASRAAATSPQDPAAAAVSAAREVLHLTFPQEAVDVEYDGNTPCQYGDEQKVVVTVIWQSVYVPFQGPLRLELKAQRKGICELS